MLAIMLVLVGLLMNIPYDAVAKNVISETRNVDIFDSVDFRGHGDLHLTQGKESVLRLEGERDLLDKYRTYVESGQLIIELEPLQKIWGLKSINVYITMQAVKGLRISGSGSIIGKSPITSDKLVIRINGSGDIESIPGIAFQDEYGSIVNNSSPDIFTCMDYEWNIDHNYLTITQEHGKVDNVTQYSDIHIRPSINDRIVIKQIKKI